MRTATLSACVMTLLLGGCGDSSSGAGGGPPLTRTECPGKPAKVTVNPVAPFWSGLVAISFTSSGKGMPSYSDVQLFDPALGAYSQSGTTPFQKPDGTFLALVNTPAREESKDLDFKIRVRSELDGCAPSDWVESSTFKLGNPLPNTSWVADLSPAEYSGNLNIYQSGTKTVGPYTFAPSGVQETLEFKDDGTYTDVVSFGIESGHAGDLYDGCRFQIHSEGQWEIKFLQYSSTVLLSQRKLSANPLSGSTCNSPSIGQLAVNQPGFDMSLPPATLGLGIDYTALLYSPPGKVKWTDTTLLGGISNYLPLLVFTDVNGTATINGYLSPNQAHYEKQ